MLVVSVLLAAFAAAMSDETGEKATASGCDKPSSYDATLKFDKEVGSDGKYPNGTLVQASCDNGGFCIRDGGSHALCLDGQWVPKLGRCPYYCQLSQLKQLGYSYTDPNPDEGASDYVPHGSLAKAYCYTGLTFTLNSYTGHPFKCNDGGWQPTSYQKRCDKQ